MEGVNKVQAGESLSSGKCLITGCEGFIGSHMADFLLGKGFAVYGSYYDDPENVEHLKDKIELLWCDIRDRERVESIVAKVKPDYIFHYAAQSLVIPSWQDPARTLDTNIQGTFYLLEAVRKAGIDPVIEATCSSAEYGLNYKEEIPVVENKVFRPSSPYGVSKVGTDMLCYFYWQGYRMKIIRTRPFNITGPRKRFDASSDFSAGVAAVEAGLQKEIEVGNLDSVRDITDFRDGIKAMWLLAQKGQPGEVYNICCGRGYRMGDVLDILISLTGKKIKYRQVPEKMRPLDDPVFIGDNSKLRALGWEAKVPVEKTLADTLEYWRNRIKSGKKLAVLPSAK